MVPRCFLYETVAPTGTKSGTMSCNVIFCPRLAPSADVTCTSKMFSVSGFELTSGQHDTTQMLLRKVIERVKLGFESAQWTLRL